MCCNVAVEELGVFTEVKWQKRTIREIDQYILSLYENWNKFWTIGIH